MTTPPADDELVEHIVGHLSEEHPQALAELSDAEVERRVRLGLTRARLQGFGAPEPAAAYVTLMFLVSPCFDHHARIGAALEAGTGTPQERLRALFAKTTEEDWEAAAGMGGWEQLA
jgi:hypothetical protein